MAHLLRQGPIHQDIPPHLLIGVPMFLPSSCSFLVGLGEMPLKDGALMGSSLRISPILWEFLAGKVILCAVFVCVFVLQCGKRRPSLGIFRLGKD